MLEADEMGLLWVRPWTPRYYSDLLDCPVVKAFLRAPDSPVVMVSSTYLVSELTLFRVPRCPDMAQRRTLVEFAHETAPVQ